MMEPSDHYHYEVCMTCSFESNKCNTNVPPKNAIKSKTINITCPQNTNST